MASRFIGKLVTISNERQKVIVMRTGRVRYCVKVYDRGVLSKSQLATSRRHAFARALLFAAEAGIIPQVLRFATGGERITERVVGL